jgi:hypothetical protein
LSNQEIVGRLSLAVASGISQQAAIGKLRTSLDSRFFDRRRSARNADRRRLSPSDWAWGRKLMGLRENQSSRNRSHSHRLQKRRYTLERHTIPIKFSEFLDFRPDTQSQFSFWSRLPLNIRTFSNFLAIGRIEIQSKSSRCCWSWNLPARTNVTRRRVRVPWDQTHEIIIFPTISSVGWHHRVENVPKAEGKSGSGLKNNRCAFGKISFF